MTTRPKFEKSANAVLPFGDPQHTTQMTPSDDGYICVCAVSYFSTNPENHCMDVSKTEVHNIKPSSIHPTPTYIHTHFLADVMRRQGGHRT